jgi:hypothetical protein
MPVIRLLRRHVEPRSGHPGNTGAVASGPRAASPMSAARGAIEWAVRCAVGETQPGE